MKRILKWAIGLLVLNAVVWLAGQAYTRSKTSSNLDGEDLDLYTFWNGDEFVTRSPSLHRVKVRVLMGGASIDLRQAVPAPNGMTVDVSTTMGGIAVLVRKDWDVEVIERTKNAAVEIDLDRGAVSTSDSPKVTVVLRTAYGGALVGYELPSERVT